MRWTQVKVNTSSHLLLFSYTRNGGLLTITRAVLLVIVYTHASLMQDFALHNLDDRRLTWSPKTSGSFSVGFVLPPSCHRGQLATRYSQAPVSTSHEWSTYVPDWTCRFRNFWIPSRRGWMPSLRASGMIQIQRLPDIAYDRLMENSPSAVRQAL